LFVDEEIITPIVQETNTGTQKNSYKAALWSQVRALGTGSL
jgi:hypothetical protein